MRLPCFLLLSIALASAPAWAAYKLATEASATAQKAREQV
jgi:hypothetical protein